MNRSSSSSPRPVFFRLLALAAEYRGPALFALLAQLGVLALGLAGLSLVGAAVDTLRHALDPHAPLAHLPLGLHVPEQLSAAQSVLLLAAAIVIVAIVRAVLSYVHTIRLGHLLQMQLVPRIRNQAFSKLLRLDFRFFDAHATGALINRVTSDVQHLRSFVDGFLVPALVLALAAVVSVIFMCKRHAGLAVLCLGSTPLLWLLVLRFSRRMQPAYAENRRLADELVLTLSESVQGLSVLRGFGREEWARARYEDRNRSLRDQQQRIFFRVSLFTPSVDAAGLVNLMILLSYGGYLVVSAQLSLGDLVVFAGLLQQLGAQITNLATVINTLEQSLIGARRVFEILDAEIKIESPAGAIEPPDIQGHVRLDAVSFGYGPGPEADLHALNLDVPAGSRVAILGETGSGKTTLLSLIPRFYDPSSGIVSIDGIDIRRFDLPALRRQIGIVFQESFLFSDTVAANIAWGHPDASQDAIVTAARQAQAHDFIANLPQGYQTVIGEGGSGLSGGQKQRLALARALLPNPRILLLDDPGSALDADTEHEILSALETATQGRTTFVIAHRIATVHTADLIVVMEGGRIVQRGTHEQLSQQGGPYRQAVRAQIYGDSAAP